MPNIEFNYTTLFSFTNSQGHSIRVDHESTGIGTVRVTNVSTNMVLNSGVDEAHDFIGFIFVSEYDDATVVKYIGITAFPYAEMYNGEGGSTPLGITLVSETATSTPHTSDGSATFSVTGGATPYQYRLQGVTAYGTSNVFTNLPMGTYTLEVIDSDVGYGALGFTISGTPYSSTKTVTVQCPTNYIGSATGEGTATSMISQADADAKATIAANADGNTKLVCEVNLTFTPYGITDNSDTISYSLDLNQWVSLHDYVPDDMLYTANKVMSFKGNKIYLHNIPGVKGKYYDQTVIKPCFIEMVVNSVPTNIYTNILWKTQVRKNNIVDPRKTLTGVMIYNENQCSGIEPVTYLRTTRNAEGLWKFNNFRDLVIDISLPFLDAKGNVINSNINPNKAFFKKGRFYSDYLCARLIFNNLEQSDLVLSEFAINNRVSPR